MSLNKQKMVREIGRRTRLSNDDVQRVIETLVEVWTSELVNGGRIELENFLILEVKQTSRRWRSSEPHLSRHVTVKTGKRLKSLLVK